MDISLQGFNAKHATFAVSGELTAGQMVEVKANNTVGAAAANGVFLGQAVTVNGSYALVQTSGYMTAAYTGGTAPALGQQILAANGSGGVLVHTSGRTVMVCEVDTTAKTVSFLL